MPRIHRRKPSPRFPISPARGAYTGAASSFRISTDAARWSKGAPNTAAFCPEVPGIEKAFHVEASVDGTHPPH